MVPRAFPVKPSYRLYVRLDPTVNGNGGGGAGNGGADSGTVDTSLGHPVLVASDPVTKTNAVNRDYAQPVYVALDSSTPFSEVTNGFAGTPSDGLTQLDSARALTTTYSDAANGNLVQTARAPLGSGETTFTVSLGFGSSQGEAVHMASGSLATGFPAARKSYEAGWAAYDATLNQPPAHFAGAEGHHGQQRCPADALALLIEHHVSPAALSGELRPHAVGV